MYRIERKRYDNSNICHICNEKLSSRRNYYRHVQNHNLEEYNDIAEGTGSLDFDQNDASKLVINEDCIENQSCSPNKSYIQINANDDQQDETLLDNDIIGELDESNPVTESETDEDEDESDKECEDNIIPEMWENVLEEDIDDDLGLPVLQKTGLKSVNDLLFWFIFFILYWQSVCHISDNGVEWLLRFLFQFFNVLSIRMNHSLAAKFAVAFPTSIYMVRKLLNLDRNNFERHVVCPQCFTVYTFLECFFEKNGVKQTKLCSHETVKRGKSLKCNTPLLKEVILKGGIVKLYPKKIYCFNSLINGIECILKKEEYTDLICHWKDWKKETEIYRDIYDGNVWKEFDDFFKNDRNLGLMLNIDWFQPFKNRTDYSVGVIYFVILNLPRSIRYKFENVIVVGIIPALRKEPSDLSPFLKPVVRELQALWKGVNMQTSASSLALTVRAALICVACDIPAARKTCGFKSHSAVLGCHKCFKNFPAASFGAKRNYSGFDRRNWKLRSKLLHNRYAISVKNTRSQTEFNNLSRKYGTYYSNLIELEYFDAVKFCIIDPMHNLFLGTAKSMFKLWREKEILNEAKLEMVEDRLKAMNEVTDIGRIPHKISSNYGCFNAAEWKNWTIVFSLFCLRGILPDEDYKVWEMFVLACRILCNPFLTTDDIVKADHMLIKFCESFQKLYSWKDVKPNMHLHCHLKDCLFDYGPIHVFWCFSFERFNGKFGKFVTNNRSVEVQFMRKLVTSRHCEKLMDIGSSCDLHHYFSDFFMAENSISTNTQDIVQFMQLSKSLHVDLSNTNTQNFIKSPETYKVTSLDSEDMVYLLDSYRHLYPSKSIQMFNLSEVIKKFGHITIVGERFGSRMECRSYKSANILANWCDKNGDIDVTVDNIGLRPCRSDFYFSHVLTENGKNTIHYFSKVTWYKECEDRFKYGNHLQMWYFKKYDTSHGSSFLPVQRIRCRFAYGLTGTSKDLMLVSPIPRKIYSDNVLD